MATYYVNTQERMMVKVVEVTETPADGEKQQVKKAVIVQVKGRDLSRPFCHRHELLDIDDDCLKDFEPASETMWNSLINEYIQVCKEKQERMSEIRQKLYEQGKLVDTNPTDAWEKALTLFRPFSGRLIFPKQ